MCDDRILFLVCQTLSEFLQMWLLSLMHKRLKGEQIFNFFLFQNTKYVYFQIFVKKHTTFLSVKNVGVEPSYVFLCLKKYFILVSILCILNTYYILDTIFPNRSDIGPKKKNLHSRGLTPLRPASQQSIQLGDEFPYGPAPLLYRDTLYGFP